MPFHMLYCSSIMLPLRWARSTTLPPRVARQSPVASPPAKPIPEHFIQPAFLLPFGQRLTKESPLLRQVSVHKGGLSNLNFKYSYMYLRYAVSFPLFLPKSLSLNNGWLCLVMRAIFFFLVQNITTRNIILVYIGWLTKFFFTGQHTGRDQAIQHQEAKLQRLVGASGVPGGWLGGWFRALQQHWRHREKDCPKRTWC